MQTRNVAVAVLAFGLIASLTNYAVARKNQNNNNSQRQTPSQTPPPTPAQTTPPASQPSNPSQLSIDETAQKSAAGALTAAEQNLRVLNDAALAKFEQTPEWVAAQTKVTSAQADLVSARTAANDSLTNNADYQAAVAAKKKATDDLQTAKASGDASPDTLSPLATASLQATIALRKITNDVLSNDTSVQSATENVAAAQHESDVLKMKFQQTLPADGKYAAAKAIVDTAQKQYDDAHARVVADAAGN